MSKSLSRLEQIAALFSKEEIDNVVKHMPVGKAPGPDGLMGCFSRNVGASSRKTAASYVMISSLELWICKQSIALSLPLFQRITIPSPQMISGQYP